MTLIRILDIIELDRSECLCSSCLLDIYSCVVIIHAEHTRDHPHLSSCIFSLGDIHLGQCLILRWHHFLGTWEIDPELDNMLDPTHLSKSMSHKFIMHESRSCSHPLHLIWSYHPSTSCCITMLYLSTIDDRHCLESPMWMISYSRPMGTLWWD